MKMSLLEIVQDVLSDMNSDEVNSFADTLESLQVAQIAKTTYFEIMARRDWPHLRGIGQLDSLSDTTRPSWMGIPDAWRQVEYINYNARKSTDTRDKFTRLQYKDPASFLHILNQRNESTANITQYTDTSGVGFNVYTDRAPSMWTSFDDEVIIMDAYDSAVENTLHDNRSQVQYLAEPSWTHDDTAVPDLPDQAFPGYLAEVKSSCFAFIKETVSEKAEQRARRQSKWMSTSASRTTDSIQRPSYGRPGRRGAHRNPQLSKD